MPVQLTCPSCRAALSVPESFLGKSLKCKHCGETFRAKGPRPKGGGPGRARDDDDRPRQSRPRDDDTDEQPTRKSRPKGGSKVSGARRRKKAKSPLPLVLGLVGGLVLLAGLGTGVAYLAGAFDSDPAGPRSGAGRDGGDGGGRGAGAGKVRFGSPPRLMADQIQLSQPVVTKVEEDRKWIQVDFRFTGGQTGSARYFLVVMFPHSHFVLPMESRGASGLFRLDVPAGDQVELWVGLLSASGGPDDMGDRVSNVVTFSN